MSIVEKETKPSGLITLDANAVTEIAAIRSNVAEIRERFALLEIEGPQDKAGYDRVHAARMEARDLRLSVQKRHEAAKKAALDFGRKLDAAKNKIVEMIEPIEAKLQAKEDGYEASREAIKRKAAAEAQAKLQARVDALGAVGGSLVVAVLQSLTDEQFAVELSKATEADSARKAAEEKSRIERERQEAADAKAEADRKAKVQARIKAIAECGGAIFLYNITELPDEEFAAELEIAKKRHRDRKEENDRLDAERAKLDADRKAQEEQARIERQKLEDERRMQAEAQRKIDAENNRLAAERQRIEREEFERNAKAKAEQDAREKLERERVEQERLAKEKAEREAEEAKRREAMKPDLQKLREYVVAVEAVPIPEVQDPAVYQIVLNMAGEVERMCQRVETWIDEQGE